LQGLVIALVEILQPRHVPQLIEIDLTQYSATVLRGLCWFSLSGVMNMEGSLAASISPIIFAVLAQRGLWIAPFFISAGVLLTGALIWTSLIDPEGSVVEDMVAPASA
jgi:hypothetical protein